MNITKVDFVILNNASFEASVELKESELPIDLTGFTFYMQCRPSYQSSTVYFKSVPIQMVELLLIQLMGSSRFLYLLP